MQIGKYFVFINDLGNWDLWHNARFMMRIDTICLNVTTLTIQAQEMQNIAKLDNVLAE